MISFFSEDIDFEYQPETDTTHWLTSLVNSHAKELVDLNYIFCSDPYLLEINREYLAHDYYTDIITFDLSESQQSIEGEIYISIDRVNENAQEHRVTFEQELHRVMAHGVLHLIGLNDETEDDQRLMRQAEESALAAREIIMLAKTNQPR